MFLSPTPSDPDLVEQIYRYSKDNLALVSADQQICLFPKNHSLLLSCQVNVYIKNPVVTKIRRDQKIPVSNQMFTPPSQTSQTFPKNNICNIKQIQSLFFSLKKFAEKVRNYHLTTDSGDLVRCQFRRHSWPLYGLQHGHGNTF